MRLTLRTEERAIMVRELKRKLLPIYGPFPLPDTEKRREAFRLRRYRNLLTHRKDQNKKTDHSDDSGV